MRVLGQRGVPGFKVRRYRITREGPHAIRERWDDVYPPTAQIIRVGTGAMSHDRFKGKSDSTPEYVADEVLIMTNLSDPAEEDGEKDDDSGILERREPGRYGSYGWTAEAGMPIWRQES
jgi:hypothetical protein